MRGLVQCRLLNAALVAAKLNHQGMPLVWFVPDPRGFVLAGRINLLPKPFPVEFRADVIAVARNGEAPLRQISKDYGISEASFC